MDEDVRILNRNFSVEVDTYIDSLTSGANKIIRALSEIERSNANKRLAIEYFEKKDHLFQGGKFIHQHV